MKGTSKGRSRVFIASVRAMFGVIASVAVLSLSACGGGGGDGGSVSSGNTPTWTQNSYPASSTYAAQCAAPRTGTNPLTGSAYTDQQGSVLRENFWLRSYMHELYLWYGEVADSNPASFSTTAAYFENRLTTAIMPSGHYKDRFSFTLPTSEWIAYALSGESAGYGVEWVIVSGNSTQRDVRVAYVEPGSPAATAGLSRGDRVLSVDGTSIDTNTSTGIDVLNAGLWPSVTGQSHAFQVSRLAGGTVNINMTSATVTSTPVLQTQILPGNVGYVLFNSHIATAEQQLVDAFTQLQTASVSDLVLDLRYNGGGFLDIASEVAYMIAGSQPTSGKVFERLTFNNQYATSVNPVTGGSNTPTPFHTTTQGFSGTTGASLPVLNLTRVFVITSSATCSASESIINGLRGVGVEVIQIGGTTCGKPYGFYAKDNCGTTYFPVEFQGVNEAGFGDYAEGFTPQNSGNAYAVPVTGCSVADDFTQPLGSSAENGLEMALYYRTNNVCTSAIAMEPRRTVLTQGLDSEPLSMPQAPWKQARILRGDPMP